ncbi:hypothetical protein F5148DRAFT_342229 [Russula earlei]|uniref:Uncharacterized protein n=1 Tax=Russula earlei TaxID=71964 RepID=A0ACC0U191_9AGAM|nr:hypothetical protein F5148DRAFT_342229 [Russula earlei]
MHSSLGCNTTLFLITIIILSSFITCPVSSFPVVAHKLGTDWSSQPVSSPSGTKDQRNFDIMFAFVWLLALYTTWLWVARRAVVNRLVTRIHWLVLAPHTIAQRFSYSRLDAFLQAAIASLSINEGQHGTAPPRGGPSAPVSTAPRPRSERVRFMRVSASRGGAHRTLERNLPIASPSPV